MLMQPASIVRVNCSAGYHRTCTVVALLFAFLQKAGYNFGNCFAPFCCHAVMSHNVPIGRTWRSCCLQCFSKQKLGQDLVAVHDFFCEFISMTLKNF